MGRSIYAPKDVFHSVFLIKCFQNCQQKGVGSGPPGPSVILFKQLSQNILINEKQQTLFVVLVKLGKSVLGL